jgi:hypothetical protein
MAVAALSVGYSAIAITAIILVALFSEVGPFQDITSDPSQ